MGQEAPAEVYDAMHAELSKPHEPVARSYYYPMWQRVVRLVQSDTPRSILEVGCGGGKLAEMLMAETKADYRGFDFSPVAVMQAALRTGLPQQFFTGNALDKSSYDQPYDCIVCTEVLEHIDDDLGAIKLWKSGAHCVCSVPNFDYPSHVRHFRHEDEVRRRYGDVIAIDAIERVAKPLWRGTTFNAYFRQVRWARNKPKRMLGLLGINRFDWNAGWFLFSGRRRS